MSWAQLAARNYVLGSVGGTIANMIELSAEQQQSVVDGKPVEVHEGGHVFYVISKEQFELWQQLRSTVEEIDPSFYEADDIADADDNQ